MNNKISLESLSMDLLRVALGMHRGSYKMAERFSREAMKRRQEINEREVKPYLRKVLSKMENSLKVSDPKKKAEDSLMYSTIIRNYCLSFLKNS